MKGIKLTNLADIEKLEETPLEEQLTATNTYDMIKQGAALDPSATAISFMTTGEQYATPMQISYADLIASINRTANLFHDLGVGPKDVVSYLLPNLPQTHFVLWGGEAAGIVNPINPMLEADTIRDICEAAGTKVLVALGEQAGNDIWQKVGKIRKDLPNLKTVVRVMGSSDEKEGTLGFDEVLPKYNGDKLDSGRIFDSSDIVSMYHTGGTTGTPKLVSRTHHNETVMIAILKTLSILNQREALMGGLPLFHVNGTIVTGGFPFAIGAQVVMMSTDGYRDPTVLQNFYKIVEHYKATSFSAVPTILSVLLDLPKGDADISSLNFALCGAAPLSVELLNRFEKHTDMRVLEGYGLTEGTAVASINPVHGESRAGSIGIRLPYTQMDVFIREGGGVRQANVNEIGSICIKGPTVFSGYLEESKNKDIWMKEGWFDTGDLGRKDTDGYFWLTGREKDLIIRGGHNIDPSAIEEALFKMDGIQNAAAVGSPDPHSGEVPVVFAQLRDGSDISTDQIMEHLQNEVGERAAIPKKVYIVDEIPLTAIGKIFKPTLRYEAIRDVYESAITNLGDSITSADVTARADDRHGTLVEITVKPSENSSKKEVEEQIKVALARYTVQYQVEFV
ncbi:MAG: acyl-CoA synthetase [Deltaproteobacteria bacterium]|nr:acyl-CoA synthetase [Deltaproteobacteria bacterium]